MRRKDYKKTGREELWAFEAGSLEYMVRRYGQQHEAILLDGNSFPGAESVVWPPISNVLSDKNFL